MARNENQLMLGANLECDFVQKFWDQAIPSDPADPGQKTNKSQIIQAMANLWLDIPAEIRRQYLWPTTNKDSFTAFVQKIVQSQLEGFRSGLTPAQQKILDKDIKQTKRKLGRK